jgi:hypothetical protein
MEKMMKTGLIIHDSDTATLFIDTERLPEEAEIFELVLNGVPFEEIKDDEIYLWIMDTNDNELQVVEREGFDFDTVNEERYPIQAPIICLDKNDPYFAAYQELNEPNGIGNTHITKSHRNWDIEEPPYSKILVDSNGLKIIKVERVDDTGRAAELASDMSHGSEWCTVDTESADDYLQNDGLYFILLNGDKYLCHVKFRELRGFTNDNFEILEDELGQLLSEYIPNICLFMADRNSQLYKNTAIKRSDAACEHACYFMKKRWPEAEPIIANDPGAACLYAHYFKFRWPEAEPTIMNDPLVAANYAQNVLKGRWLEAESIIIRNPDAASNYAQHVLKGRWPEAEPIIIGDPEAASYYAENAIKSRWIEAEPNIIKNPAAAFNYAQNVLKARWPEAEPSILNDAYIAKPYREYFRM